MPDNDITINCDGLCEPTNPGGYACWAWVAYSPKGARLRENYGCLGHGAGMTNNRAEYAAILDALRYTAGRLALLYERGMGVVVYSDSQLVINQINGKWRINSPDLQYLAAKAEEYIEQFMRAGVAIQFLWVPREENMQADALTRKAYQEARAPHTRRVPAEESL